MLDLFMVPRVEPPTSARVVKKCDMNAPVEEWRPKPRTQKELDRRQRVIERVAKLRAELETLEADMRGWR